MGEVEKMIKHKTKVDHPTHVYPMGDRCSNSKQSNVAATAAALAAGPRLAPQLLIMFRAVLASPQRTKLLLLAVAIVVVIGTTAFGQIRLNAWN